MTVIILRNGENKSWFQFEFLLAQNDQHLIVRNNDECWIRFHYSWDGFEINKNTNLEQQNECNLQLAGELICHLQFQFETESLWTKHFSSFLILPWFRWAAFLHLLYDYFSFVSLFSLFSLFHSLVAKLNLFL